MKQHLSLTELYCGENPIVDIVAVHGLGGDAIKTWTARKSGKCWLRDADMLPSQIKQSRILTYSYNADVVALCGNTCADRIMQHAHTLAEELCANRQFAGAVDRPIVFVCHSLGGIIVKRTLIYAHSRTSPKLKHLHSLYVSTYGLLFLGTPHNGTRKANLASAFQHMIKVAAPSKLISTEGGLLDALQENSEILQNINDMFAPLMRDFHIHFFWEEEKTELGFAKDYVVSNTSAAPILDDTGRAGLPYNHVDMAKFEGQNAPGYTLVVATLMRYSEQAQSTIARRWVVSRNMLKSKWENEVAELLHG